MTAGNQLFVPRARRVNESKKMSKRDILTNAFCCHSVEAVNSIVEKSQGKHARRRTLNSTPFLSDDTSRSGHERKLAH